VAPQRESLLAGGRANINVPRPRDSAISRPVIGKATPPPAPIEFQARQQTLAQNQGRPLAPEQVNQLQQQQPAAVVNRSPFRSAAAAPVPNGAPRIQLAQPGSERRGFQNDPGGNPPEARPADRFESRPPNARPFPPNAGPANQPVNPSNRPGLNRPEIGRPQQATPPAPVPIPESRPAQPAPERRREFAPPPQANQPQASQPQPNPPQANPQPRVNRPAPENRPNFNRPESQPQAPRPNVAAPPPANRPAGNPPPANRPAPPAREAPGRSGDRRDDRHN
jgi:hypothetical protein